MRVRNDETIKEIAERCKCSPSQIILSYITMQDLCIVSKSTSKQHYREDVDLQELRREDFDTIDNLGITHRHVDPTSFGPESSFK